MLYVSNHDVIGGGTEFERFGPALDAAVALSLVTDGMPLIFNGQEAGNRRRLSMFKQDPITWRDDPEGRLYARLLAFRRAHPSLWAPPWGGPMVEVATNDRAHLLAFRRDVPGDTTLAVFNLSPERRSAVLRDLEGAWRDQDGRSRDPMSAPLDLPAWSYRLFTAR